MCHAAGRYVVTVAFPCGFRAMRIVDDRFYGIARDEFDVQPSVHFGW